MNSELVIKVKYGDTLRRFNVFIQGNGSLDLDMAGLRAKIFNIFKFTPDADLTLTYIDEDSDVVTLVDDADLRDAIRQRINPLRISILMNSDRAGIHDTSGSSTPMRSPHISSHIDTLTKLSHDLARDAVTKLSHDLASKSSSSTPLWVQEKLHDILSNLAHDLVPEVAHSTLEKLHDFLSKLYHEIPASKAAPYTAPVISELLESFSKLGFSHQDPVSKSQDGTLSNKLTTDTEKSEDCKISDNPKASEDPVATPVLSYAQVVDPACDSGNLTRGVSTEDPPIAANVNLPNYSNKSGFSTVNDFTPLVLTSNGDSGKMPKKNYDGSPKEKQIATHTFSSPPTTDLQKQYELFPLEDSANQPVAPTHECGSTGVMSGNNSKKYPSGYPMPPYMGRVFHQGVQCDGCGVHPITGPRFKSKVKEDYDLCSICFIEMGNVAEYIRMDRPMCYRPPRLTKFHSRFERPLPPHGLRGCGMRSYQSELDSRFIQDVNIVDGTLMAPATPFTKIWRMRNNGIVAWPRGTQLVWIGGDQLTNIESMEVEIPVEGCVVGMDIDVAVDFTAPERPGQYVSYWRMALPSGQKFGQCVWVLIQVDTPQQDSRSECCRRLNLNLPPNMSESKDQIIDVNVEPVEASHPEFHSNNVEPVEASHPEFHSNMPAVLVKPMFDGCTSKDQETDSPVNDSVVCCNDDSVSYPPQVPAVSYPSIDFSVFPSKLSPDVPNFPGEVSDRNTLEQSLLKELDEMGFKQIDLNKEILRVNEYDLERSVDDLCGVAEWDPMLEELEDMGFCDKETNKRLLIKNGGSIKRVVMDLIAAEKA